MMELIRSKQELLIVENNHYSKQGLMIVGALSMLTVSSGAILASSMAVAEGDTAIDTVSIDVPTACTLGGTVGTAHTASVNMASVTNDIGTTTLQAFCNDASGLAIYAIGFTGDTDGDNTMTDGTHTIATGTNTTGDSSWAMKLSTDSEATYPITIQNSYDDYHAVPNDYQLVAKRTASTDTGENATGANLTTTYRVYIANLQPAGSYTGQVKYVLVHPNDAAAPVKPLGLCTSADTCMQQQTSASLAQKLPNVGSTTTLYDARDNQAYTVAKLADGKYWMTENLNLAGGTALSANDTDITNTYIASFSTSNNLTKTDDAIVLPASSTSGFSANNYSYVYNSNKKTSNCNSPGCYSYYSWDAATLGSGRSISTNNTDAEQSICPKGWKLPNTRTDTDSTSNFRGLIIGLGGSSDVQTYTSSTTPTGATLSSILRTSPNSFLFAGNYGSGSFSNGGSLGGFWSSTSSSINEARYLYISSSLSGSANIQSRSYGQSVRCLFDN